MKEQAVILQDVSWQTYECLLEEFADRQSPRLTYDRGMLEIMSPITRLHERNNRNLQMIVEMVADVWGLDIENVGSMTFKRATSARGFEPDSGFYIQNADAIEVDREIDLDAGDPPPDLVIEVDVTSPSLDRLPVYAGLGVPEVWRWSEETVTIRVRVGEGYELREVSSVLTPLTQTALNQLMVQGRRLRRRAWLEEIRAWARRNTAGSI